MSLFRPKATPAPLEIEAEKKWKKAEASAAYDRKYTLKRRRLASKYIRDRKTRLMAVAAGADPIAALAAELELSKGAMYMHTCKPEKAYWRKCRT